DGPRAHPQVQPFMKRAAFTSVSFDPVVLCGISTPFGMLSPARGKITHVLLTRAPLYRGRSPFSFDLHVLGAPLTFALSQDQTLQLNLENESLSPKRTKDSILALSIPLSPVRGEGSELIGCCAYSTHRAQKTCVSCCAL